MQSSKQILADIEEEAIHVWREWPRFLVLKLREKTALLADMDPDSSDLDGVETSTGPHATSERQVQSADGESDGEQS